MEVAIKIKFGCNPISIHQKVNFTWLYKHSFYHLHLHVYVYKS